MFRLHTREAVLASRVLRDNSKPLIWGVNTELEEWRFITLLWAPGVSLPR